MVTTCLREAGFLGYWYNLSWKSDVAFRNLMQIYNTMLRLDDDCLVYLLSYLGLTDLYNIGKTCRRINELTERVYVRFTHLDARNFFITKDRLNTVANMIMLIEPVAPYVKSFKISQKMFSVNGFKCRSLVIIVLNYCINITELKVGFYIYQERSLREICALANNRYIETLEIRDYINLQNFTNLKSLTLTTEDDNINLSHLLCLKNLHSLCLDIPLELSADLFAEICDNNPGLIRISLNNMCDTIIKIIIHKLVYLEDFTLPPKSDKTRYTISGISKISQIKSLKSFTTSHGVPHLLTDLAHIDQLEALTYTGENIGDTYKIKYFTKLKYLKTTNLNGPQLKALKCQDVLEHLDISESNYVMCNEDIADFYQYAIKLKYLGIYKCTGLDEALLDMLSEVIKSDNIKPKLTVACDLVRKPAANKYYQWMHLILGKRVRFASNEHLSSCNPIGNLDNRNI